MTLPTLPDTKTTSEKHDVFFLGWLPMPPSLVHFLGWLVVLLLIASLGIAAVLALFQKPPGPGLWRADEVRSFAGLAYTRPYAMIRIPGETPDDVPRTLLLVEAGKFGALPRLEAFLQGRDDGVPVQVTGTILQRDGRSLLELLPGENGLRALMGVEQDTLQSLKWPPRQGPGDLVTYRGEIIDPKCYLGAMKPGGGKTHKACAMLCIAGGIPPMLVTRDATRQETYYLLVTEEGRPANDQVREYVGDSVEVTGRLEQQGDLVYFRVSENGIRRW